MSNLGSQLTVVAVGLQVYALTGSTLAVGVLGIFALVPLVALGLYGGALVDAYDRRRVALLASWALWVVTGLLALQAWLDVGSVGVLYGLVALQSAAFAINNPARSAIIPRLVEPRLLPAANALQTISWSIALTVGPLLGAFLVALWGYGIAYTIDAVLFAAALWAVWRLPSIPPVPVPVPVPPTRPVPSVPPVPPPADPTPTATATPTPTDQLSELGRAHHRATSDTAAGGEAEQAGEAHEPATPRRKVVGISSVVDGLRYLATRPNVRTTFLVDLAAMILAFPRVLLPAVGVLFIGGGETTTGVLSAAFAVGAVLAGVFSGALSRVRWQGLVIAWAITAWGLSIAAFGAVLLVVGRNEPSQVLVGGLVAACVALALAGASDGERRLPTDDPADRDPRRHARPPPGRLHRGGRRWPTPRRGGPRRPGELVRRGVGRGGGRAGLHRRGVAHPAGPAALPAVRRAAPRAVARHDRPGRPGEQGARRRRAGRAGPLAEPAARPGPRAQRQPVLHAR